MAKTQARANNLDLIVYLFLAATLAIFNLGALAAEPTALESYSKSEIDAKISTVSTIRNQEIESIKSQLESIQAITAARIQATEKIFELESASLRNQILTSTSQADKLHESTRRWVESQRALIAMLFTVLGILFALAGVGIPYFMTQKLRIEYQDALSHIKEQRSSADSILSRLENLHKESDEHAEAIKEQRKIVCDRSSPEATEEQKIATKEMAKEEELPFKERLRTLGLAAVDESDWESAGEYWKVLRLEDPENALAGTGENCSVRARCL
jgi:Tfp pilus assembly major pilin PilA